MARRMTQTPEDKLQLAEVAALLGLKYNSAKVMRARKELLKEDGMFGRTPWWYRWRVEQEKAKRPKQTA